MSKWKYHSSGTSGSPPTCLLHPVPWAGRERWAPHCLGRSGDSQRGSRRLTSPLIFWCGVSDMFPTQLRHLGCCPGVFQPRQSSVWGSGTCANPLPPGPCWVSSRPETRVSVCNLNSLVTWDLGQVHQDFLVHDTTTWRLRAFLNAPYHL